MDAVLLRLPYLALSSVFTLIRLWPMSEKDQDAEILVLRHQLAVLQRQVGKPTLTWPDRAVLAALLHQLPRWKLHRLHLLVSPETVLRWHRDLLRPQPCPGAPPQAPWPAAHRPLHPPAGASTRRREPGGGGTSACTANWPPWASRSPPPPCGTSSTGTAPTQCQSATAPPGPPSSDPRHRRSSPSTSSRPKP